MEKVHEIVRSMMKKNNTFVANLLSKLDLKSSNAEGSPIRKRYKSLLDGLEAREYKSLLELLFAMCYRLCSLPYKVFLDSFDYMDNFVRLYPREIQLQRDCAFMFSIILLENLNLEMLSDAENQENWFLEFYVENLNAISDINDRIYNLQRVPKRSYLVRHFNIALKAEYEFSFSSSLLCNFFGAVSCVASQPYLSNTTTKTLLLWQMKNCRGLRSSKF
jgi:hypothetical protein